MVCWLGLPPELSSIKRASLILPVVCGLKFTNTLQLAPGAKTAPLQLLVNRTNSFVPIDRLRMFSGRPPVLVIFTVTGVLVVPMIWFPKVTLVGEKVAIGTPVEVPVRETV